MPWLLLGAIALGAFLYISWRTVEAEPSVLARNLRIAGIGALGIATVALALTGRIGLAAISGAGAAGLWRTVFHGKPKLTESDAPSPEAPKKPGAMTRAEALDILGLADNASDDDIKAAHRRLIAQMHPDKGGSDWLAARLNEAKDALLEQ